MRAPIALLLFSCATASFSQPSTEIICSYAPSQSKTVAAVSGLVGGAGATASAVASATGMTAVVHSSGAMILSGTSGYIAGTIGAPAAAIAASPVVVAVGLVVAGSAVTIELVCAPKNHPEQVEKLNEAAAEFSRRFKDRMQKTKIAVGNMKKSIAPATERSAIRIKQTASDIWQYAYQKGVSFRKEKLR